MKLLLLVRHAKTETGSLTMKDADRALNERGLRDAPEMGRRIHSKGCLPDLLISSTAKRAAQTARLLAAEMAYPEERIQWTDTLYLATAATIGEVVSHVADHVHTLMIVAHNPGITNFVNAQCGFVSDNIPTGGVAAFEADISDWSDFDSVQKSFVFYDFPKNLQDPDT